MTKIYKSEIIKFCGSWGSGLGYLFLKNEDGLTEQVPCENSPTVRALEDAFGNVITRGHTADCDGLNNQWIYWYWDDMGLALGGFVPERYANDELIKLYKKTKKGSKK